MFNLALEIAKILTPDDPAKASLVCLDNADWSIDPLPYNPEGLQLRRSVNWAAGNEALAPWGSVSYTRGSQDELSFTLLFDESELRFDTSTFTGSLLNAAVQALPLAVMSATTAIAEIPGMSSLLEQNALFGVAALYRLTMPVATHTGNAAALMRPPVVGFCWGPLQFVGVIENLSFDIKPWDRDGFPRRAEAQVTMKGRAMQELATVDKFFDPSFEATVTASDNMSGMSDERMELVLDDEDAVEEG